MADGHAPVVCMCTQEDLRADASMLAKENPVSIACLCTVCTLPVGRHPLVAAPAHHNPIPKGEDLQAQAAAAQISAAARAQANRLVESETEKVELKSTTRILQLMCSHFGPSSKNPSIHPPGWQD